MIPASVSHILLALIVAISILLMLMGPRDIPEVYWVGGGAILLIVFRLIPLKLAGKAAAEGSDVYLFLVGMMLLSELAREHGVFDWLSSAALKGSHGSSARLFTLVYGVGTLVTIFMSNDATAVVLTPAILAAIRKARVAPLPYLLACAMIANAASFVLPISNPANLVVFRSNMPPLGRWLASFGLPSILSIAATYLVLRFVFRKELADGTQADDGAKPLSANGVIVLGGIASMVAVLLTASSLDKDLGLPACLAALAITAVVCVKARSNPWTLMKEISWATIALVAGLFIMVEAVQSVGALKLTQAAFHEVQRLAPAYAALATGFVVGIANNLVNNLPLGLIAGATLQAEHARGLIADAVLIGVDLGPNLSVTGSLATILWLIALRKEKLNVSGWDFFKAGALAMPVALAAAMGGVILMQIF
ncbi:MAG: arsenical pump rane protein [Acidobacteriaceae bacterium]|nr:arsenical pump rane protein [Acidobacteriaceae bacterium]